MEDFKEMQKNWWVLLLEGFLFVMLGTMVLVMPQITTLSVELIIGSFIIVGAIMQLFKSFKLRHEKVFWPTLLTGIVGATVGVFMLTKPITGAIVLSILVVAYFGFEAIFKLMIAMLLKPHKAWKWFLFSSLVTLILLSVVLLNWPLSATYLLGILFGANMLTFGISLVFAAFGAREIGHKFAT